MEISIAKDFSPYPAGRTGQDGPNNGTRFRKEHLVPALKEAGRTGGIVTVDFDGVRSFGTSFLEEAFGGLVRLEGFEKREVQDLLELRAEKPVYRTYKRLALRYIKEALPEENHHAA
ncbi:STAS-like domain-containing protein [Aquamicrobium segne]|uniref:STAS-like domain-containing protein n=1 Tax=Aquamicrobium segne TaxID=469547 RepID=A0ABW0GUH6_9HYPH